MLHPNAKDRLKRVLPTEYDVSWTHPTTGNRREITVEPDIRWQGDELPSADDYPIIALELSPEGIPRSANGEAIGVDTYREDKPSDDSVAYVEYVGKPMYAQLNIVIAVDTSQRGVPDHVIADAIAHEVYFQYEFNTDHLNTQGTTPEEKPADYEWPLNVRQQHDSGGVTNMNEAIDEQFIQRRVMSFRVDYRFWKVEEVPALEAIEYEIGVDLDYDWEIEEDEGEKWYGPFYVDVGLYS